MATGRPIKPTRLSVRAFTMLEVCLALFIVMLVVGIALPFANGLNRESALRTPADELKKLALTARRAAVTDRKTYELILDEERYVLRVLPIGEDDPEQVHEDQILQRYELPRDVKYAVKRWDEKEFGSRQDSQWRFLPTGICEPITVRFAQGEDWLQFSFNPLTAASEDEMFYFR